MLSLKFALNELSPKPFWDISNQYLVISYFVNIE